MSYHILTTGAPPAAPAAGKLALYANTTDGLFHSVNSSNVDLILNKVSNVVTFTANGTYTTPAGVRAIFVRMVGAGGGGGGAALSGASNACSAGGGAAGGYLEKFITTPNTTYAVTCGVGGLGGAATGNNGGAGSNSVFGTAVLTAQGGAGGTILATGITVAFANGGTQTAVSTGGDLNAGGDAGRAGIRYSGTIVTGGAGASSPFGNGGQERTSVSQAVAIVAGQAALGFGAGGGGGTSNVTTGAIGGAGTGGYVEVLEFA